jgi:hypothetical protein
VAEGGSAWSYLWSLLVGRCLFGRRPVLLAAIVPGSLRATQPRWETTVLLGCVSSVAGAARGSSAVRARSVATLWPDCFDQPRRRVRRSLSSDRVLLDRALRVADRGAGERLADGLVLDQLGRREPGTAGLRLRVAARGARVCSSRSYGFNSCVTSSACRGVSPARLSASLMAARSSCQAGCWPYGLAGARSNLTTRGPTAWPGPSEGLTV